MLCSGYMSPEYAMHGRFSEKSDVYSFGVLILEIVSGRKNSSFYNDEDELTLFAYVSSVLHTHEALMSLITYKKMIKIEKKHETSEQKLFTVCQCLCSSGMEVVEGKQYCKIDRLQSI